jgi:tetratricopeptide (TPR) repeat protein
MKPLGTITKYYPFIDSETRNTLDSIMAKAQTFDDYVHRLTSAVCNMDVHPNLAHVVAVLTHSQRSMSLRKKIEIYFENIPIAKPWFPFTNRGDATYDEIFCQVMKELINLGVESWILIQLYIRHASLTVYLPEALDSLEVAEALLNDNPELECFVPDLRRVEYTIARHEGDMNRAFKLLKQGVEIAKKYNDLFMENSLILEESTMYMSDLRKGHELVEKVYKMAKTIGISILMAKSRRGLYTISSRLGEYDLALRSLLEAIQLRENLGEPYTHYPCEISHIYSSLQNADEALVWAQVAMDAEPIYPGGLEEHICPRIAMGRALILKGRMKEALEHIEKAKEIAHKSGLDRQLAQYYRIAGQYEIASGNIPEGMELLERALESFTLMGAGGAGILRLLTSAEIDLVSPKSDETEITDSGLWMIRLENYAKKNKANGYLMIHAMLKARLQLKLGDTNLAKETLSNALKISDSPGVSSLHKQIVEMLQLISVR